MSCLRPRPLVTLIAAAFLAAGCAEEFPPGHNASVSGTVMDSQGNGLGDIMAGAVFTYRTVPAAPGTTGPMTFTVVPAAGAAGAPVADAPVRLYPPYPNPLAAGVSEKVTVRVECDVDTTGRLEVYAPIGGVPTAIATLRTGGLSAGSHAFTWDAINSRLPVPTSFVPNGLYEVRLTVPADPPSGTAPLVLKQNLLINRPAGVIFPEAYNYRTAADGYFVLDDLGVGEPFTLTSATGEVLGARQVGEALTVHFRDANAEFRDAQSAVTVGPRDQVTIQIEMIPVFGGTAPLVPGAAVR